MTAILQRHGQIAPEAAPQHTAWQRFEHDAPNQLWARIVPASVTIQQAGFYFADQSGNINAIRAADGSALTHYTPEMGLGAVA